MLRVFLSDDLITEVLSFLPVRSLLRFKCVCKSWKTLVSDPTFVKLHLKRSARNKHIAIFSDTYTYDGHYGLRVTWIDSCDVPMHPLPENTTIANDPYLDDLGYINPVGSCNGLLCLLTINKAEYSLYLWNPATRSLSNEIEFVHRYKVHHTSIFLHMRKWNCGFGYDNSTGTYKIVCLRQSSNEARVLNIGDNVWRNIQSFPDAYVRIFGSGVYVTGSLNWLTIRKELHKDEDKYGYDAKTVTINQFVIVSLDLSKETYSQLLPPRGFDKVPRVQPKLDVLMDSLCFSHDFNGTDLIIWQMKEFGVQESWIQFLKISYHSLPIIFLGSILFPFYLSGNGDTLILAWGKSYRAILYNLRNNTVEETRLSFSEGYVESLVSTC